MRYAISQKNTIPGWCPVLAARITNKTTLHDFDLGKGLIDRYEVGTAGSLKGAPATLQDTIDTGRLVLKAFRIFQRIKGQFSTYQILAISLIHNKK
jgi:hypothetical protein